MEEVRYDEDSIRSLDPLEHVRLRPGMYIGKLGDGSSADDGIYVLLKEVIDNSIDEFIMGAGKTIDVKINDNKVEVRDYGRGIPLGKVVDVVSKMNTGGKYDSRAFKKSIGLNGVGTKAVNALSAYFKVESVRDNQSKSASFERGILKEESPIEETTKRRGTGIVFIPDDTIFKNFKFRNEYVVRMLKNYVYLNPGLTINYNGEKFYSENGLRDLLAENNNEEDFLYPIIHLKGEDIEVAISHSKTQYSEEYYSFVNGQNTTQGGTHLNAFKEAYVKTIRDFYKKNFDPSDVRKSIIAGLSIKVMEPVFESQTKTKLGSTEMGEGMPTVRTYINDFISRNLDDFLHKNNEIADAILRKIMQAQREREELAGIRKLAKDRAKKANLHNRKLRDCRVHLTDTKDERALQSTLFITEGDSASGSITKSRDVTTQAVFSLRGKPLNTYGMTKKIVYENEEFNLLQAALNIEDSMDDLRYNNIVVATDADVDGAHIETLMLTFIYRFMPELIKEGHVYIAQPPLYKLEKNKKTWYAYTDEELNNILSEVGRDQNNKIQRYKGLGEMDAEQLWETTMDPERRVLKKVVLDDSMLSETDITFNTLMGDQVAPRREFIEANAKYVSNLDI